LLWSLFFQLYMCVLIKWSELWKLGSTMHWTYLDYSARSSIYLLEYFLITMARFMATKISIIYWFLHY
jgi:hypothetical protein